MRIEEPLTAAQYVAAFLEAVKVRHVYLLSGGMIAPLIDAIARSGKLRLVLVSHEQAGAFAAEAEARITGVPAVAMGTSGPGVLNLISGIASCHYDSIPAIFIGGQVQTYFLKGERATRQFGLQETPFADVAQPVAKAVIRLRTASDIAPAFAEAFAVASGDRPGPVAIEFPYDLQGARLEHERLLLPEPAKGQPPDHAAIEAAARLVSGAERPVVLAGGGVRAAGMMRAVRDFLRRYGLPAATTMAALDLLPADEELRIGLPGIYGTRSANTTMGRADLILVLGSRLDHGVLGFDPTGFARSRRILQVDLDTAEMSRVRGHTRIVSDLRDVVPALDAALGLRGYRAPRPWAREIAERAIAFPDTAERPLGEGLDPNLLFDRLGRASRAASVYVVDAGQHTFFCAQSIKLHEGQRYVSSIGLGSMGTALPGAIGAALATGAPVVSVSGDGAIQLNLQDLHTVRRERLPVKFVVMNNSSHGLVRQFQKETLDARYHATLWNYDTPDFKAVFAAYGIPGQTISTHAELEPALEWLWRDPFGAQLLECRVDPHIDVIPAIRPGRQIYQV